jgi:hypothetical protein
MFSISSSSSNKSLIINYITLIYTVDLSGRHNFVNHRTHLAYQRSSSNPMKRLRGPTQTISFLLKLCLERNGSLLRNENVVENGEMRMILKPNNIPIYN